MQPLQQAIWTVRVIWTVLYQTDLVSMQCTTAEETMTMAMLMVMKMMKKMYLKIRQAGHTLTAQVIRNCPHCILARSRLKHVLHQARNCSRTKLTQFAIRP